MMMMLLQDEKPMKYQSGFLKNASKFNYDLSEKIGQNLVDNSIVSYNNELDEIAKKRAYEEIPYFDLVKGNFSTNEDNGVTCRVYLRLSTIQRFQNWHKTTYSDNRGMSREIDLILNEFLNNVDANAATSSSSSFIKYNYKEPRLDVLKKLLPIAEKLNANTSNMFTKSQLLQIVSRYLGYADPRVIEKYHECLLLYSITRKQANIQADTYNMNGFYTGVLELMKKRSGNSVLRVIS